MNVGTSGLMWFSAGIGGTLALLLPGTSHAHLGWLLGLSLAAFAWRRC